MRIDFSVIWCSQISDMLQKDPEQRPSAKDIFTRSLPPLTSLFRHHDDDEEEEAEDANDMAKTHTKYIRMFECLHAFFFRPIVRIYYT